MSEDEDLQLWRNCTILAVNQFPWTTSVNDSSSIAEMNETRVVELVSEMMAVFMQRHLEDDSIR